MTPRVTQSSFFLSVACWRSHSLVAREFLVILACKGCCFSLIFIFVNRVFLPALGGNYLKPKADRCQKSSVMRPKEAGPSSPGVTIVSDSSIHPESPQNRVRRLQLTFTSLTVFKDKFPF